MEKPWRTVRQIFGPERQLTRLFGYSFTVESISAIRALIRVMFVPEPNRQVGDLPHSCPSRCANSFTSLYTTIYTTIYTAIYTAIYTTMYTRGSTSGAGPRPALSRTVLLSLIVLSTLSAQVPTILQVRVVDGDAAVYAIGSRATRGITVQVTDESGKPVEAATVSFRLPEEGPSGTFSTGSKTEIATTRGDGRASVWGMQWNRTPGSFEVRVTVAKGQTRAGTVCSQFLSDSEGAARSSARTGPRGGHKWLWVALAVAGAAAGGVVATGLTGKPGSATTASAPAGLTISAPTIILGHP